MTILQASDAQQFLTNQVLIWFATSASLLQDKATLLQIIRHHCVECQAFENIHASLEVLFFILKLFYAAIYMRGPPVKCRGFLI